jgi:hypothetical protein
MKEELVKELSLEDIQNKKIKGTGKYYFEIIRKK